jgi:hypothetical protein
MLSLVKIVYSFVVASTLTEAVAAQVCLLVQGELVTEEMSANPIFSNSVKFNQIHN